VLFRGVSGSVTTSGVKLREFTITYTDSSGEPSAVVGWSFSEVTPSESQMVLELTIIIVVVVSVEENDVEELEAAALAVVVLVELVGTALLASAVLL